MNKVFNLLILTTLILISLTLITSAAPNITSFGPASDPTNLSTESVSFNITSNESGTVKWYINSTLVQTNTSLTNASYTNASAGAGNYNITATITNEEGSASKMWNLTRTTAPTLSANTPTASSTTTTTNAVFSQVFNASVDRSSNVTWKINGTQVQYNSTATNLVNYTNSTAGIGTYSVTAIVNNSNGTGNTLTWTWIVKTSTMSSGTVVTNYSTAGRVINRTNSSLNFSWTDTGNITTVNLTFPTSFNFSALAYGNISSNLGNVTVQALDESTGLISLYNATGLNNSAIYVNLTTNVTSPAAGDFKVNITTNKNNVNMSITVYSRSDQTPHYVQANNSNFTVTSESFTTTGTVITLSGIGVANLTIKGIPLTGQNLSHTWKVSNASITRALNDTPNTTATLYIITLGTVTNPIITIEEDPGLSTRNTAAGIVAGVAGIIIIYKIARRKRSS